MHEIDSMHNLFFINIQWRTIPGQKD
jgi:hypothetical protein